MSPHEEPHPLAGHRAVVNIGDGPIEVRVTDWADRLDRGVAATRWRLDPYRRLFASMLYAVRAVFYGLPADGGVVHATDRDGLTVLLHWSELPAHAIDSGDPSDP